MELLRKNFLLFVVFLTGSCVLILEVTATRMLSPYFGNTIYTVSSIISVILLALSIGYYTGGRLEKKASTFLFYAIIASSGVFVLMIYLLNLFLIPYIAYLYSIRYGPL